MFSTTVLLLSLLLESAFGAELDYGMVMDVGSSHTQLFVYAWNHRVTSTNEEPKSRPIEVGASRSVPYGITNSSSYESVVTYLRPLISDAKNITSSLSSRWATFPIYFKATAGMRILNDDRRTEILSWVRTALSNSSFNPFLFESDQAVILSGEEEAMFDWLTVNYLNDRLDSSSSSYQLSRPRAQTLGSLDLGGQSTQITFAAVPSSDILQSFTGVRLWGEIYRLYTHSFLGYGSSAMYDKLGQISYETSLQRENITNADAEMKFLQQVASGNSTVWNPCLNDGLSDTFNVSSVYNNGAYYEVTERGQSTSMMCRNYVKQTFYNDTLCVTGAGSCSINGVYQKKIYYQNMTFYAFSGFAYTILDFGLSETIDLAQIHNISQLVCNMTYTQLNNSVWAEKLKAHGAYDYLNNRCLMMTYVYSLLHDAYGFPDTNSNVIFVATTPNGTTYDWTVGSILRDSNWLSYTLKTSNDGLTAEGRAYQYIAFTVSGILLVTCGVFIYYTAKRRRDGERYKGYGKMKQ